MLVTFLRANVDVFAWQASNIPGVPREVIEHHLAVCPHARPIKEKVRKQALERQEFITKEIRKLEAVGLVRGMLHPTWLANPVVVRKANGKWTLCIDFTDVNKACTKDPFPLPRLLPASAKGAREVERRGKMAGPVAGRGNVYLNDVKD